MSGAREVLVYSIILSTTFFSFSQSGNYKFWSAESPLSWDDFYEIAPKNDSSISNFEYRIGFRYEKKAISDTILIHTEVYAYMYKKNSWVKDSAKTSQFLAYHQLLLDMLEICKRKTQRVYYTVDDPYTADSLFEKYTDEYENERIAFTEEYFSVNNKDSLLDHYQQMTREKLESDKPSHVPPFKQKNLGYGVNAALGYVAFNNSLGNRFKNSPLLNAGIDLEHKKIAVGINGYIGWNQVKNTFTEVREWEEGLRVGVVAVELNVGYNLTLRNFTIRPFGGVSYFQISPTGNLNARNGYTVGGSTLVAGVIGDYKLRKSLKLIPGSIFYNRIYSEMDLRFKLQFMPMNFGENFQSNSIQFSIGVSTISKVIEVK